MCVFRGTLVPDLRNSTSLQMQAQPGQRQRRNAERTTLVVGTII